MTPTLGARVRIREEIDIYPIGVFPVGLTGTVTELHDHPEPNTDVVVAYVRLDQHFDALDEWENQLQVFGPGPDAGVTWESFELIPAE